MSIEVTCSQCGTKLKAPEAKAGKTAKCGKCHGRVLIPGAVLSSNGRGPVPVPVPTAEAVDDLDFLSAPTSPPAPGLPAPSEDPSPFAFGPPASPTNTTATPPARPATELKARPQPKVVGVDIPTPPPPAKSRKPKLPEKPAPPPVPAPAPPLPIVVAEQLPLDDNPPAPQSAPTAPTPAGDPFAFSGGHTPLQKTNGSRAREKAVEPQPKAEAAAPTSRYVRPGERRSSRLPLYAAILGIAALAMAIVAVIVFVKKSKPPEPAKKTAALSRVADPSQQLSRQYERPGWNRGKPEAQ